MSKKFAALALASVFISACSVGGQPTSQSGLPTKMAASRWRTSDLKTTPLLKVYDRARDGDPLAPVSARTTQSTSAQLIDVEWIEPVFDPNAAYGIQADFADGSSAVGDVEDANDINLYFPDGSSAMLNVQITSDGTNASIIGTVTAIGASASARHGLSASRSGLGQVHILVNPGSVCAATDAAVGVLGAGIGSVVGSVVGGAVGGSVGSLLGPLGTIVGIAGGRLAGRGIGAFVGAGVFVFVADEVCENLLNPTPSPMPSPGGGGDGGTPVRPR